MLKKIICNFIVAVIAIALFMPKTILQAADENGNEDCDISLVNISPCEKEGSITIDHEVHSIYINYETGVVILDGESLEYEITPVYSTNATIDYSSAINFKYKVPWKGSAILTAAAIAAIIGNPDLTGLISTAISALTADEPDIWAAGTRYFSKEQYYSSTYKVNYRMFTDRNIYLYKYSISPANKIAGPYNSGWYDPMH